MNRSWTVAGVKRQGRLLAGLAVALPLGAAGLAVQAPGTSGAVAGIISTVVGGVGGPGKATTIPLAEPYSVAYSARTGDVYASSLDTVREVDPQTDQLTTVAGTNAVFGGPLGDGGPLPAESVNLSEALVAGVY